MRDLSEREQALLVAMLEHGQVFNGEAPITREDRQRWLRHVPTTRAGRACGCSTCPSVELLDAAGGLPGGQRSGVVLQADAEGAMLQADAEGAMLQADAEGAMLLLFVYDGRPSYLELAPVGGAVFAEFPSVDALTFN